MSAPADPVRDPRRLAALRELNLLDTPPEAGFDRLTHLATRLLRAPVALLSLVDDRRQFFKSLTGLTGPAALARGTPLSHSFCQHVVRSGEALVVDNAPEHPLVCTNLAIPDLGVRAYLGIPIRSPDGAVIGSYCAIDTQPRTWTPDEIECLTALAASVEAEVALRAARDQAIAASRLKTELLATVSHEIRTPMNAVIGMSSLLAETPLDASQQDMVHTIQQSAEALLSLLNDLVDISRIESGKLRLDAEPLDLRELLQQAHRLFVTPAQEKGLALTAALDALPATPFLGDAGRIRQVVTNLLGNAVKFTARGRVHLRAELIGADDAHATVRLSVEDTGPGLRPEDQQRLFQPFTQFGDPAHRAGGAGLGLAITHRLIGAMGGTITCTSELGRGTTFRVELPLPRATPTPAPVATPAPAPVPSPHACRVLVADDNEANRYVARLVLENLGCEVAFATNGRECLEVLALRRCDAVLLDCQMPLLDGYETTRLIRSGSVPGVDPRVLIIAVTAYSRPDDRARCLEAGMDDYLSKPLHPADVRTTLERWRNQHRLVGAKSPAPHPAAAPAPAAAGPTVLDADTLASIRSLGDEGESVLLELVRLYRADAPSHLARLRELLAQRDGTALGNAAHAFGGGAASFGGKEMRTLCLRLEQEARAQRWEAAAALVREVEAAVARLEVELQRHGLVG